MTHKVRLIPEINPIHDESVLVDLPFPPFYGLFLRLPWRDMDYCEVDHICWDEEAKEFQVFFDESDCPDRSNPTPGTEDHPQCQPTDRPDSPTGPRSSASPVGETSGSPRPG